MNVLVKNEPKRTLAPDLLKRFTAIVGEKYAITDKQMQEPYLVEMRDLFHGVTPVILRPGSVAEVAAIVKLANETKTAIVPQGGNTGLVGGQIPHHNEVVLSLNRLDKVREVDPVSNTMTVEAGVTHVQGTANGYGERAGNANLFSVVAGLQLKKGQVVLDGDGITEMTRIAHAISEVTNVTPDTHQPYVGLSAFAHKAGLHASAIRVDPMLYQHIDPAQVGNDMRMLVSDMAGRASVELKGRELGFDLSGDKEVIGRVTDKVKELEATGYSFEAADASFELLLRDELAGERRRHFTVESWRVIVEQREDGTVTSEATVRLVAKGERVVAVGEGNGPVNALDRALRAALEQTFPELATLELTDYKVRILEGSAGTGAITRVLIESSDAEGGTWSTVGVDENVISASWHALEEAVTYGLLRAGRTLD